MAQVDAILGKKVHDHLVSLGLETPMTPNDYARGHKIELIEERMKEIMQIIGLDVTDDSLIETPRRIAKMWVNEFFSGLDYNNFPKCTTVENKMAAPDEFVCVKNIQVISMCEHHFLPFANFDGKGGAVIAYIPKSTVLGLSKLSRLTEYFASRPQIQERLTNQIAEALKVILDTDDVAVYIDATHTCMSLRGSKDPSASTATCAMGGRFLVDANIRSEFLNLARTAMSS